MPTKYDLFELMYSKGCPFKPQDIARTFQKPSSSYHGLYQLLLELEKDNFIQKNLNGFQVIRSAKHDLLYKLIRYCIANNINYNELLDKNITEFIHNVVHKKRFGIKDVHLNARTFTKYVEILSKNCLLIILSRKPIKGIIPYNSFIRDLLRYFHHKCSSPKIKIDNYIDEIEKELKRFNKLVKRNERKYLQIIETYEIRFVQHSLNLEGNPITLPETIKLLKEHITPKDMNVIAVKEVQNYQEAVQQMLLLSNMKRQLTKETILDYHYRAMRHANFAGQIRQVEVYIKHNPFFKIAKVDEIGKRIQLLLDKYILFSKKKHTVREILQFSAYIHNEFQHIHPFQDGNSRTTRLLTFHFLRANGVPIIDIPLGLLEEYLLATKEAKERNDRKLNCILQQIIFYNLKMINEQLQ